MAFAMSDLDVMRGYPQSLPLLSMASPLVPRLPLFRLRGHNWQRRQREAAGEGDVDKITWKRSRTLKITVVCRIAEIPYCTCRLNEQHPVYQ